MAFKKLRTSTSTSIWCPVRVDSFGLGPHSHMGGGGGGMTFSKQCYLKIYTANTHAEREKQSQVKMKVDFYVDNSLVKKKRFKQFKVRDKL
jgi:hypothetical protein